MKSIFFFAFILKQALSLLVDAVHAYTKSLSQRLIYDNEEDYSHQHFLRERQLEPAAFYRFFFGGGGEGRYTAFR